MLAPDPVANQYAEAYGKAENNKSSASYADKRPEVLVSACAVVGFDAFAYPHNAKFTAEATALNKGSYIGKVKRGMTGVCPTRSLTGDSPPPLRRDEKPTTGQPMS